MQPGVSSWTLRSQNPSFLYPISFHTLVPPIHEFSSPFVWPTIAKCSEKDNKKPPCCKAVFVTKLWPWEGQIGDFWCIMVNMFIVYLWICRRGFLALANLPVQPLGYRAISFKKSFISKDFQISFFELFWALFTLPTESLFEYSKIISIRSITYSIQNNPPSSFPYPNLLPFCYHIFAKMR